MLTCCMSIVYRPAVTAYGLWLQLRVDHGKEFYLVLFVQELLRCLRGPRDVLPYVHSPSTEVSSMVIHHTASTNTFFPKLILPGECNSGIYTGRTVVTTNCN